MEKINLLKIFNNYFDCYTEFDSRWAEIDEEKAMRENSFNEAMMEFGKKLLKLAAENAKIHYNIDEFDVGGYEVDKQSITDIIKYVE